MYRIGRVLSTRHLSNRRQRGQLDRMVNSMVQKKSGEKKRSNYMDWVKMAKVDENEKLSTLETLSVEDQRKALKSILLGHERIIDETYRTIEDTLNADKVHHLNYTRLNLEAYYTIHFFDQTAKKNLMSNSPSSKNHQFRVKVAKKGSCSVKVTRKKDSILRYTGKHYNEEYALVTRGMPYIDKNFKKCHSMNDREDIIDQWKTITFDQIAKFEETVLSKYTNFEPENKPVDEDLPIEEGHDTKEDNIYQYYNQTIKKFIRQRKHKNAPTLQKVLAHRFSPKDLEIYRAWKAGAIRRMPLKTELITQNMAPWKSLCRERNANVDFEFIENYQLELFQSARQIEGIERQLSTVDDELKKIKRLKDKKMSQENADRLRMDLSRLENEEQNLLRDLAYAKCQDDLRSYRLHVEIMKIPNFISNHTYTNGGEIIENVKEYPAKNYINDVLEAFGVSHADTRLTSMDQMHLTGELALFDSALRDYVKHKMSFNQRISTGPMIASFINESILGHKGLYNDKTAAASLRLSQFSPLGRVYTPFVANCFESNRAHQFYTECEGQGYDGRFSDMYVNLIVMPDGNQLMCQNHFDQLVTRHCSILSDLEINYQVREAPVVKLSHSSSRSVEIYLELDGQLCNFVNIDYRRQFVAEKLGIHFKDENDVIGFCHTVDSTVNYNLLLQAVLSRHSELGGRTVYVPSCLEPVMGKSSLHAKSAYAGAGHWYAGQYDPKSKYNITTWPGYEDWERESRTKTDQLASDSSIGKHWHRKNDE